MGQVRKVGDVYYIEFYARGLMYSQVAGTDFDLAKKLLEDTELKISGGEALTVVREIDWQIFSDGFLSYAAVEFGFRSQIRFNAVARHFSEFINREYPQIKQLSKLTPSVFESYKSYLMVISKPALVNFTILLLREMMEYGIKLGFINDNPTLHIRLLEMPVMQRLRTKRYQEAELYFLKKVSLGKIYHLLKISDIGKIMYFRNLIPLSREDMYN